MDLGTQHFVVMGFQDKLGMQRGSSGNPNERRIKKEDEAHLGPNGAQMEDKHAL